MKLAAVILENFRGYCQPTRVEIDEDLTAFIGKSDAGKSTILEALEIFFNDGKPEHGDACVHVSATDSRLMGELVLVCKQPGKHAYSRPRWSGSTFRIVSTVSSRLRRQIRSGAATSPMFGRRGNGITWLLCWCWICSLAEQCAGHSRYGPTPTLLCKRWKWRSSSAVAPKGCCFIRIKVVRADSTGPRNTRLLNRF